MLRAWILALSLIVSSLITTQVAAQDGATGQSTRGTYVRPIVQSITNSGKLTIQLNEAVEFPDDIVD